MKRINLWARLTLRVRDNAGFSLVEIMVAIAILTIGLLGAGKLITVSSQYQIGYQDQAGTWHKGNIQYLLDNRATFNSAQSYRNLQ